MDGQLFVQSRRFYGFHFTPDDFGDGAGGVPDSETGHVVTQVHVLEVEYGPHRRRIAVVKP